MNISEKIEKIRKQPEHVRLRYVWICVIASMFVVLMLWFFSIASMFMEEKNNSNQATTENVSNISEQLQTLQEQAPSLKDLDNQSITVDNKNTTSTYQNTDMPASSTDNKATDNETPSNIYSSLPSATSSQ